MKFKRSYSNARNLGSAYKFAFVGDINRALLFLGFYGLRPNKTVLPYILTIALTITPLTINVRVILVKYLFQI